MLLVQSKVNAGLIVATRRDQALVCECQQNALSAPI